MQKYNSIKLYAEDFEALAKIARTIAFSTDSKVTTAALIQNVLRDYIKENNDTTCPKD